MPPAGIEGIELTDKAAARDGVICYGALGVGDAKMKIHKAAVAQLFAGHDQMLDAEEIYDLGAAADLNAATAVRPWMMSGSNTSYAMKPSVWGGSSVAFSLVASSGVSSAPTRP